MHRSLFCFTRNKSFDLKVKGVLSLSRNAPPAYESGSIPGSCIQRVTKLSPSSSIVTKSIHTTNAMDSELGDKGENDNVSKHKRGKKSPRIKNNEEELKSAAVDAAKSLPGDWTRVAEELMSRLTPQDSKKELDEMDKGTPAVFNSQLSTMKVARSYESGKEWSRGRVNTRRTEGFNSLYSQPCLGIFNVKKLQAEAGKNPMKESDDLWSVVRREKIKRVSGSLPKNGFEEMIKWTEEGRIWTFPIDNEEDMHEERQYEFHEHVFLNQHLKNFPTEGPLRRFMDLVVIGLSKNPWISVPEKVEHIRWYAEYFSQKQKLLESSIGEKAKIKQS